MAPSARYRMHRKMENQSLFGARGSANKAKIVLMIRPMTTRLARPQRSPQLEM
jgi:hypothetical protein